MNANEWMIGIWGMVLCSLLGVSSAMANPKFPEHIVKIYGDSPNELDTKIKIEKMMGTYLTKPPRRHRSERVSLKGLNVLVDVWQSVYGLTDNELKCRAIEWLVFGRTQYSQGGREVLSELPTIRTVTLRFHEIEHKTNTRRTNKQTEKLVRYLSVKLSRKHLNKLKLATLRTQIETTSCERAFKGVFSGRFSARYTKKRRQKR